jgi:hypothetical protein
MTRSAQAEADFQLLNEISRTRALTHEESERLLTLVRGQQAREAREMRRRMAERRQRAAMAHTTSVAA